MSALAPPKKAPGELVSKTGRKLIVLAQYAALTMLANVFGGPFWFIEQRRSRLADELERRRA